MASLSPSTVIAGKYRLSRPLGRGGMGEVWIAENVVLQKNVALKVIADGAASTLGTERFLREAIAASRVRHPAIVEIHDAGIDGERPWMAMELLEGESLAGRIARRPLSTAELGTHVLPIVDALAALHDAGVVHRDLKPDNIFLETIDGHVQPKLLDFGIAKQVMAVSPLTKTGELVGTGHYLSPEQARGARDLDARSDLYSMGVVIFEALSGTTPYEAETLPELIAKLFTEPPRELRKLAPSVPEALAKIVHRCLEREPGARPPSARVLASELRRVLAAPVLASPAAMPPRWAPRASSPAQQTPNVAPPAALAPHADVGALRPGMSGAWIAIAIVIVMLVVLGLTQALHTPTSDEAPAPRAQPALAPRVAQPPSAPLWVPVPSDRSPDLDVRVREEPVVREPPTSRATRAVEIAPARASHATHAAPTTDITSLRPRHAVLHTGELDVRGSRASVDVRQTVRRAMRPLTQCAEASLSLYPSLSGRTSFELWLGEDGIVDDARVAQSTIDDDEHVEACMLERLRALQFGDLPHGDARVTVAFVVTSD